MKSRYFLACMGILVFASAVQAKDEFPGRKLYPTIPYIELKDFKQRFDKVIVVDVRSAYEYKTLRVKGALNIPVASSSFVQRMKELRAGNPNKTIVVYCNGKTCMKSYKAARKCKINKILNVLAYDAGIMDWAKTYPDKAILLGASPIDPRKLISKMRFKKHLLKPEDFERRVGTGNVVVLDMRDRFQREGIALFVGFEHRTSFDDKALLDKYIRQANNGNKPLLIYDAVGKQVHWFMYYLESKNVKDYYFMKGGARAYYAGLRKQFLR